MGSGPQGGVAGNEKADECARNSHEGKPSFLKVSECRQQSGGGGGRSQAQRDYLVD
jgi:hypothetical protein